LHIHKIIFAGEYNNSEILSGPEKVAKRIFNEFTKKQDSLFITYFQDGAKYGFIKKLFGFEEVCKVNNSRVVRCGIFRLILLVLKENPDIFHFINYSRFLLVFVLLKLFLRYKIIFNIHGVLKLERTLDPPKSKTLYLKDIVAEYILVNTCDKLLILSDQTLKTIIAIYNISSLKIHYIKNGVDDVFYDTRRTGINIEIIQPEIVFVTDKLTKAKGIDVLINFVAKTKINLILNIVSTGNISFSNKNKNVRVNFFKKMPTDKFAGFLCNKHIFLTTSVSDSFNISAAEAAAAGLVPVLSEDTGFSNFITDNVNGFIIKNGDIKAIENAVKAITTDFGRFTAWENNEYLNQLKWDIVFNDYIKLYNELTVTY
jgi:glycosyltransferase involved in cell wall biosynthesis